ncbi:hypothetical protein [Brevibacillus sp. NRS-1366]|uniref:hypothetical protein n=1 Tax=Brevibacillus sp. NRS-1366 TaxID=3233899 RepID=UPI003D262030
MTYTNNNIMQSQQPNISGAMGSAGAMFQPGFAGTNVQEVQHWNHGGQPQSLGTPTYGMSFGTGISGAQSMFSPGFAGTNAQEVRQLNSGYGYSAPQQQFGYGQTQALNYLPNQSSGYLQGQPSAYIQAQPSFQQANYPAQSGSIFSPGFAGTNVQEVQARNHTAYNSSMGQAGYSNQTGNQATMGGSIFSPGFAGTNVQEVRQLNQSGYAPTSMMSSGYMQAGQSQQQPQGQNQQMMQGYQNPLGMGIQTVFTPGFAGTNTQEVRQLNAPGHLAPQTTGSIFPGTF